MRLKLNTRIALRGFAAVAILLSLSMIKVHFDIANKQQIRRNKNDWIVEGTYIGAPKHIKHHSANDHSPILQQHAHSNPRSLEMITSASKFDTFEYNSPVTVNILKNTLSSKVHDLARAAEARIPVRNYLKYGSIHFNGGGILVSEYLERNGWTRLFPMLTAEDILRPTLTRFINKTYITGQDNRKHAASIFLFSCYGKGLDILYDLTTLLPNAMVTTSLGERLKTSKKMFYKNTRKFFENLNCDYRSTIPETYLVNTKANCQEAYEKLSERMQMNGGEEIWFTKSVKESFGRGLNIRKTKDLVQAAKDCANGVRSKDYYMIQMSVVHPMYYNGRSLQARHYLVVLSHGTGVSVYFVEGYYNVGNAKVATDELKNDSPNFKKYLSSVVPNAKVNTSPRIEHFQLEKYLLESGQYTMDEVIQLKQRIKKASLAAYMGYEDTLDRSRGTFSIFGVDMIFNENREVFLLETNCNCELFNNVDKFGQTRVDISKKLIQEVLDYTIAGTLDTENFFNLLKTETSTDEYSMDRESLSLPIYEKNTILEPIRVEAPDYLWNYYTFEENTC